jgi:hypothetical protein
VNEQLLRLAERQHGLLTTRQVVDAGHRKLLRRRLAAGEWVVKQPQVVGPAAWQPTFAGRLTAVRLAVTAAGPSRPWCFSHTTAASLLTLRVPEPERLNVLLPMTRRKLALRDTDRHFTEEPLRTMRVQLNPVPFLARTIVQCAAVLTRDDLLSLVEHVVRSRRIDLGVLRDSCARGTSGSAALRDVLDELSSEGLDRWVRRLLRLLGTGGLPRPRLEVPMFDSGRVRAYLDGYWEEACLALEVDDWETHGLRDAQERDRQRDRWLLTAFGIVTVRVTPREIRDHPDAVVADLVRAYHRPRS